jgi:hypothetical protein
VNSPYALAPSFSLRAKTMNYVLDFPDRQAFCQEDFLLSPGSTMNPTDDPSTEPPNTKAKKMIS